MDPIDRRKFFRVAHTSCGGISELVPDLIVAGVEILNPVQIAMLEEAIEYGRYA